MGPSGQGDRARSLSDNPRAAELGSAAKAADQHASRDVRKRKRDEHGNRNQCKRDSE